jgi:hypothetical protein
VCVCVCVLFAARMPLFYTTAVLYCSLRTSTLVAVAHLDLTSVSLSGPMEHDVALFWRLEQQC